MPEIPDVIAGSPVQSAWGNSIRDRSVQRYSNALERDQLDPLPQLGALCYLEAEQEAQSYNGTDWVRFAQGTDGIPEAPIDGQQYARQDAAWSVVTGGGGGIPEAPADGVYYGRRNELWEAVTGEAPDDALAYVRQGKAWVNAGGLYLPLDGSQRMTGQLLLRSNPAAIQFPLSNGFGLAMGQDPNDPEGVRFRFGGSSPEIGRNLNLVAGGDVRTIQLDAQAGKITANSAELSGQPVWTGRTTVVGSGRGTTAPPSFGTEWAPLADITVPMPAGWGSVDLSARGEIHVAGGATTYQVRTAVRLNGVNGTFNQSGNSSAAPAAQSSASHTRTGLTGASFTVGLRGIMDDTGGTLPTVTKYAWVEYTMVRAT